MRAKNEEVEAEVKKYGIGICHKVDDSQRTAETLSK
jgi:hypothetical protein